MSSKYDTPGVCVGCDKKTERQVPCELCSVGIWLCEECQDMPTICYTHTYCAGCGKPVEMNESRECSTCSMPVYACQECVGAGKKLTCPDCADNFG